ncbi:MAG: ABC-2 family transporter protein [Negativicutes bacterium]|nr:ABC-2 family transporter protein [Negativicutes bacterium]
MNRDRIIRWFFFYNTVVQIISLTPFYGIQNLSLRISQFGCKAGCNINFLFSFLESVNFAFPLWSSFWYFIVARFYEIDGFTDHQLLLCFAVVLISFSPAECVARGFDRFAVMTGIGEFDRILVRPRNEIFQILATKIELTRLGRLLQASSSLMRFRQAM